MTMHKILLGDTHVAMPPDDMLHVGQQAGQSHMGQCRFLRREPCAVPAHGCCTGPSFWHGTVRHACGACGPALRSVTHVSSLGHRTACTWRPEKTEMWPPRTSTYSLSWLDTADMRACAARGGTMLS